MTFNPYDELAIDRDATAADIKRAYRRRTKSAHPDAGGSSEAFNRVARAMLVLSDPERRAKYDRTGEIDEAAPDNAVAVAISIIVGYVAQAVTECIAQNRDPCTLDLVAGCREHLRKQIAECEQAKRPIVRAEAMLRKIEKRLRAKKNANPLLKKALLAQASGVREPLAKLDRKIAEQKDALKILDFYEFDVDRTTPQAVSPAGFFFFGTGRP